MSEKEQRQVVVKALRSLDAQSIENRVGIGTPDVTYVYGWIELKCQREWPAKPETPVKLDHDLSKEQRIWLKRRWNAGGEAYVLLHIAGEWLLFDGPTAANIVGTATQDQLQNSAVMGWDGNVHLTIELANYLKLRAMSRFRQIKIL